MIGELSLYGIYMPWLLVLAILTLGVSWSVRRLLALTGVYRLVWHPALFDAALYVVLLYGMVLISPFVFSRAS
jgi:protein AaeX